MNDNQLPPNDDDDLLFAEYALGVLTDEERHMVEVMAAQNPRYAAALGAWASRFAAWTDEIPHAQPSTQVWQAIDQRLFPAEPSMQSSPSGWWDNLRVWRWTTAAALAACLLLSIFVLQQAPQPTAPSILARLQQDDGGTLFTATAAADGRSVLFVPTRSVQWQDKTAQAWLIGADGVPRSLGLLSADAAVALEIPAALSEAVASGATLAVSLEPPGGSPTGLPTGPVVAKGKLLQL